MTSAPGTSGAHAGPSTPSTRSAPGTLGTPCAKISFQRVGKTFPLKQGEFTALGEVSLDIADREFVTVVGPSGCGKSTLLNLAAGLAEPSTGQVLVDGAVVAGPGPERGVIFQQYALFPWLTVRGNVEFGLKLTSLSAAERRRKADHAIELVGLTDFADALPKTLSGGMKQRCAIARAYAVDPEVLLMDEPFGALDALTRVQLQDQLLHTWARERRTVLFVTHDVDEAVYLARRVVVMAARPGRVHRVIEVDLPYPRTEELRLSPEFARIRNEVWHSVYHQEPASPVTPAASVT
ncbi:NitT/TauT family transport system ATP-binding protein [Streptomyces aurantiacus]|uniref:ABC transporter ATP-binding protein n=1 Tax=Streptomyces aurantiacus TaxID=47760 RepID=UPI002790D0FD|nr:ABC transporter ATP-binding protein [Streptomyces aurantiacus]MDQ0772049.1 NitT/TauT family transport system ATP-binding protein [Streptomyces aurantiacus]